MPSGEVLVVEDDPEINQLVGAYVELAGYRYRPALDGKAALAQFRAQPPDLVILDVMLPDVDGFEVCRSVKSSNSGRVVPVVMLTALDGEEPRRKGMECGASDYMTKPFDPDRLMNVLDRMVKKQDET